MLPLQLQPESHIPLYIQLRDQVRALVHTGELRPGDRIPATRELAINLGVHRTTVANAYAELESEGLIRGHVGRGTFIAADGNGHAFTPAPPSLNGNGTVRWESLFADERSEEALSRLVQPVQADDISFVAAKPDQNFFPLAEMRNCCAAVMRREGEALLQLGPSDGYPPLKKILVEMLAGEGLALKDENLLITDGCQQALDLVCKAFLRPGDSVIIENPTYPGAIAIFASARVRCLSVPVHTGTEGAALSGHARNDSKGADEKSTARTANGAGNGAHGVNGAGAVPRYADAATPQGIDLAALEATLLANRVKLMVLTPDFHNPTGTTMPLPSRRKLLELAAKYQVPIVEDHIYARLHGTERAPSLKQLDRSNLVIQMDSFSKVAFPGLRVGWVVAPANVIERLRLVKQTTDLHTDQLAQAVLAEFTRRGWLARHVAKMRKVYGKRLALVQTALAKAMPDGTRWTRPSGGMAVWVELPPGFDASELLIHVRERGVLFAPGRYFYTQNPQPNTFRLSFTSVDERRITRGIAMLGEALKIEMQKRQRGARHAETARVALV
jgi:2-aminoadipate transaminase